MAKHACRAAGGSALPTLRAVPPPPARRRPATCSGSPSDPRLWSRLAPLVAPTPSNRPALAASDPLSMTLHRDLSRGRAPSMPTSFRSRSRCRSLSAFPTGSHQEICVAPRGQPRPQRRRRHRLRWTPGCHPGTGAASRNCHPATDATVSTMNRDSTRPGWARIGRERHQRLRHGSHGTGRLCAVTWVYVAGTPNGIRTRVATLRGWCPRPLDDGGRVDESG